MSMAGVEIWAWKPGGVVLMINDTNTKRIQGVSHSRAYCFDYPFCP